VPIFGDGAANTGAFAETLNLAAVWKAPIVFVCENNGYGQFTPTEGVTAGPGIFTRSEGYGVPGLEVDGEDIVAVHVEMRTALERARSGEGPTLLECRTTRWHGHHEGDERYAGEYRPAPSREGDPIKRLAAEMDGLGLDGVAKSEQAEADARKRLAAALEAALEAPEPEPETALTGAYV
jgi:pyruvate dehydrogenase E1 component alpha subunit